jgi:hypothetical protein
MKRPVCWGLALVLAAPALGAGEQEHVEVWVQDGAGERVDPETSHASFSRTLPPELGGPPGADTDALSFLLISEPGVMVESVEALTRDRLGKPLDVLSQLQAEPAVCPAGVAPELICRRTPPLRLVTDALEREHVALARRSLRAELGGSLSVSLKGRRLAQLWVGGPRRTRLGPITRLQAQLRAIVLKSGPRSEAAVGGSEAEAKRLMRRELQGAEALWGQCGVELVRGASIEVVAPPAGQLLTVGCGIPQRASGGTLRLRSGKRRIQLETVAGESPTHVALRLADALGYGARVFENMRASSDAVASVDLQRVGRAAWEQDGELPLSSDETLSVCLAELDLSNGLSHFGDRDAFVGTSEERALLRAFDDGDPRTIEVLLVPRFAGDTRIGESFIVSPGSSLSSSVIVDRSALQAGARSFALAHELGHVLLAMPGHPDDFGVDQSWSLMDADVADATIFGPRRLSTTDCERMLSQSGPDALVPLLEPLPLRPPLKEGR